MRDYYSPGQAVHYYPGAVKWMLANFYPFLSRGEWPPRPGVEGDPSEGYIPGRGDSRQAPRETPSIIAGELMWRRRARGGRAWLYFFSMVWPGPLPG